jgi:hypothetical protein
MKIAIGLNATATITEEFVVPFTCSKCGHSVAAKVRSTGEGQSFAVLFAGKDVAQRKANEEARLSAQTRAAAIARMAKCPACGQVNEAERKRQRRRSLESGVLSGLGVTLLALIALTPQGDFLFLAPLLGLAAAWFLDQENRWLWSEVDARVTFDAARKVPREAPPRAPALTGPGDWAIPLGFLAIVLGFARWFVASGLWGYDNDGSVQALQFAVAAVALVVLAWGHLLAQEGRPAERQLLRDRLLVTIGLVSFLGYFNFGHLHFGNFVHVWDTYHYVMGAKYFPELGYDKLYDCAATVDVESGRRDELNRRTMTDLRTNLIVRTDDIVAHPERCKESFTPARWEAFKRDINAFRGMVNESRWKEIHQDHGYNATPVWTLAGHALTNLGPVTHEQLVQLNSIDPIYLLLTVLMVWWAFGPRGFAIAALTLGLNFSNRYYWTGGAFLRHDWVFYLVASICLLKKDKPFLGGMAFAYAVLLRLFPGLVVLGPLLAAGEYFRVHRKLDPRFLKWVAGGVVATVVLVGASFAFFGGVSTWQHFEQNTVKHANTPLTNHMGLRTVLSYRPANSGQRMVDNSQIDSWRRWKDLRLFNWHKSLPVFALLMIFALWMVYMALRASGPDPWFAAALGVGFIVFGAELTNYYYCFLMGIAVLQVKRREVGMMLATLAMLTLFINWGPVKWMSRWLDEQYVAMSLASLFAVVGIWWLFTKWGLQSALPPEPEPAVLFDSPSLAVAVPSHGGLSAPLEAEGGGSKKRKKDRKK